MWLTLRAHTASKSVPDRFVGEARSFVMPGQFEKRREPEGQAWAVFLFGSFILDKQNK
jgi:hypothetical protein